MKDIRLRIYRSLATLSLAYIILVVASFALVYSQIDGKYQKLALGAAESFYRATVGMRYWNAEHGGIYLPISETLQPNPYLNDPSRDITATDGQHLTKVNPAFMTRLVAARINEESGVLIHLTSLRPIRPENGPDGWEKTALEAYAATGRSSWVIEDHDGKPKFRFLDGLRVERPCLGCHAQQGYKIGEVRGGISVTMPYANFVNAAGADLRRTLIVYGFFIIIGLGFFWLVGHRLILSVVALEKTKKKVKDLEGLLPICSFCKKIRLADGAADDQEAWQQLEKYIGERAAVDFSHGICPGCRKKHYPDY